MRILVSMDFIFADSASERSRRRSDSGNTDNMSQDIVSDALNQIMNALRARKNSVVVGRHSTFLLSVLALAKHKGYISDYKIDGKSLHITMGPTLNACKAIKPRYLVHAREIPKYIRRYLPARDMGIVIISTSQGLMTHHAAVEKNLGGSIIAYMY